VVKTHWVAGSATASIVVVVIIFVVIVVVVIVGVLPRSSEPKAARCGRPR
jgi:hypothetical protein